MTPARLPAKCRDVPLGVVLVLAAMMVSPASPAGAQDSATTDYQLWPEGNLFVRLTDGARLFFLVAPVRERNPATGSLSDISDLQAGAHVEFGLLPLGRSSRLGALYDAHRLSYLRLRMGVRYQTTLDEDSAGRYEEWRAIGELTPRFALPGAVLVALRNRLDLRWINGASSWRYRPRLWLEREFRLARQVAVVPYVSAEVFYDSRYDAWVRTRYQVGAAVPVVRWFAPELYWAHQRDDPNGSVGYTNAIGIVAAFFF